VDKDEEQSVRVRSGAQFCPTLIQISEQTTILSKHAGLP
jgi:hypothetical protein